MKHLRDVARTVGTAAKFGHRSEVAPFRRGESIESNSKKTRVELGKGKNGRSLRIGAPDR